MKLSRQKNAFGWLASDGWGTACCMEISQERTHGRRAITESDDFVTFIPYAALSPYHLWIFPKAHVACFSKQPLETLAELATTLRTILGKVDGMLGNPAFNLVLRSLGPEEKDAGHFPLVHLDRPTNQQARRFRTRDGHVH
jgi:galactose-1-phosphate uridylyltransferase